MIWPVDASVSQEYGSNPTQHLPADSWLIQTFGNYQPNGHTGVDFPVQIGTPVRAVAGGVVKHAGWYSGSYLDNPYWISPSFAGFCLVIDHGAFVGIYAHLSGASVAAGETVQEGQVVAHSGNTGGSTGPHLHFEVLPDGWDFNNGMYGRVNPAQFIRGVTLAPQSSEPQELFTMGQFEDLKGFHANSHAKLNNIAKAVNANAALNQKYHAQSHAKANAIKAVVDQIAKGQNVTIDWALVEAAAKQGAAEALAEGIVTVDVTVQGKEAA